MSDESFMHAAGSRTTVVPAKARTKSAGIGEGLEGRRSSRRHIEVNPSRTQSREIGFRASTVCGKQREGIRNTVHRPAASCDEGLLRDSFYALQRQAAPGVIE